MRRLAFTLTALCIAIVALADSRTISEAQNVAMRFLTSGSTVRRAPAQVGLRLEYTLQKPDKQEAAAYLFQIGDEGGFVLVSADDRATTILGYANEGHFDATDIPENMQTWLAHYAEEIAWAAEHGNTTASMQKAQKADSTKKNNESRKTNAAPISPLLGDIVWNQSKPFWNQCPVDSDGKRCYTGCVATATTQIMRYWQYPEKGHGSHSYTWTKSDGTQKTLSASFGGTYLWDNMIPNYNNGYTSAQQTAVAELMFDMGVATDMQYSSEGSGTQTEMAAQALFTYFDYDKGMEAVRPDYCGFAHFEERMLEELQADRPVLVSGYTEQREGHAFVCDGYDGQFFHINWGWGGSQNGYFALSALDPAEQGIGGAASGGGFHVDILGVMGIQPNAGTANNPQAVLATNSIALLADPTVKTGEVFYITMSQVRNKGITGFEGGYVGFAVFDDNNEIVDYHSIARIGDIEPWQYYPDDYDFDGSIGLTNTFSDGLYRIKPFFADADFNTEQKMLIGFNSIQEVRFRKEGDTIYFRPEGDMDGDCRLSLGDLTLFIQIVNDINDGKTLTDEQREATKYADLNNDGFVTEADIELLCNQLLQ